MAPLFKNEFLKSVNQLQVVDYVTFVSNGHSIRVITTLVNSISFNLFHAPDIFETAENPQ